MPITKPVALKYIPGKLDDEEDDPKGGFRNRHTIRISLTAIVCIFLAAYLAAVLHRNYSKYKYLYLGKTRNLSRRSWPGKNVSPTMSVASATRRLPRTPKESSSLVT